MINLKKNDGKKTSEKNIGKKTSEKISARKVGLLFGYTHKNCKLICIKISHR